MSTLAFETDRVSLVNSIQSLSRDTPNSNISSSNDTLLAREITIFEAIALNVITLFNNIITNLKQIYTQPESHVQPQKTQRGIVYEFNELKKKVKELNTIIDEYNKIYTVFPFKSIKIKYYIEHILEVIKKIDKMTKTRNETIDSFSKFIIIARDSPKLQRSFISHKVNDNNYVIAEYKELIPGINIELLQKELANDALQLTLAKFVRAMTLLDNMKHRLNLKLMIFNRMNKTNEDKPNLATQLLSVALTIDDALKRFVDEPAISFEPDLDSNEALQSLQSIRDTAVETVRVLTGVIITKPSQKDMGIDSSQGSTRSSSQDSTGSSSQVSTGSIMSSITTNEISERTGETINAVSNELMQLLSSLKRKMVELSNTSENLTQEETLTPEKTLTPEETLAKEEIRLANEEIRLANEEIDEIIKENQPPSDATGGKSHKQKRRVKWSTPRRHRNSRVKSMKPKKIQNRRKTKSAHKKRATKKH